MTNRKAILVLGVHRSGTSALTRVLGLCGAKLPTRLLDAIPGDNDKGFWEPSGINSIHEELLRSIGSDWDDISDLPHSWFSTHEAGHFKERLLHELNEEFCDTSLFIIKEPRMCRLMPLWSSVLEYFGAEPLVVIPVRNPLEVAASLNIRNGLQQEKALLLWLRNFLSAERDSRLMKRTFISYSQLMGDWADIVKKVSDNLGICWPERSPETAAMIDEFLTPALRHHCFHTKDIETSSSINIWVKQTYKWALAATKNPAINPDILNNIAEEFDIASSAYLPIVDQVQNENKKLMHELETAIATLKYSNNKMSWLEQVLPDREQELSAVKFVLSEREKELDSVKFVLSEREKELDSVKFVLSEREKELDSVKFVLSEREKELDSVKSVLSEREKK